MLVENLTCEVADGLGVAKDFTQEDWVREAFLKYLSIQCYPGTVNLVVSSDKARLSWNKVRSWEGIRLPAPSTDWCGSRAWHARINKKIKAAVILPELDSYPVDKIELIAPIPVRSELDMDAGDPLSLEICDQLRAQSPW